MRAILSLLVLAFCAPFVLCVPLAYAANVPPADPVGAAGLSPVNRIHGAALLQLSPMYIEIHDTLAVLDARERQLLVDLAAATADATAEAIVREIEALPLERMLSTLRIQARYAHLVAASVSRFCQRACFCCAFIKVSIACRIGASCSAWVCCVKN